MREYEVRILKADRSTDTVMAMVQMSDHMAIRAARRIAEARPFEVWRGLECIHGGQSRPMAPAPRHPNPAA